MVLEPMGHAVGQQGMETGIGQHDFKPAGRRWISVEHGPEIFSNHLQHKLTRTQADMQSNIRLFSRMLKKSASFVLASLRDSTYRSVRLASSLAAALLDGLFEHPAEVLVYWSTRADSRRSRVPTQFYRTLFRTRL